MARIYLIDEGENPVHDPTVRARAKRVRRARDRLLPIALAIGMALSCGFLFSRVQIQWGGTRDVQASVSQAVQRPAEAPTKRPWIEVFVTPPAASNQP
ncbi:MAG: hypothetical protein RQ897_02280 [Thermoflexus sp.]|jgi:hypothetical protein|nr:hypothetical protein [Thermoflexus sp.]MDT7947157.1 hypothetical protein [Thermoflexus sp.]